MPHLRLARGLRVVRRGRDRMQVGLLDGRRAVLPRDPATVALLDDLLAGRPLPPEPPVEARSALALLERHRCVVPASGPAPVRAHVSGGLPHHHSLLREWGVAPGGFGDPVLLLTAGELPRDHTDPLVRHGVPHLVVRLLDGAALLGPFVVPGRTACLRCLDAHLAVDDPDHVVVAERYQRATARRRPDGAADVDPALATLALAWAVRDLRAHAVGEEPSTWSRTWQVGPGPTELTARSWDRHPQCGCSWAGSWAAGDPHAGTMGA